METIKLDVIFETIGHTRSNKTVIVTNNPQDVEKVIDYLKTDQHFTPDDLLDAYALFNYLALRAKRKGMGSAIFEDHANETFHEFQGDEFEQAKVNAGIFTAFDFQNHALSLIKAELKMF